MTAIGVATCGTVGVYLLYTRIAFGQRHLIAGEQITAARARSSLWLRQAGLRDVKWPEFIAASVILAFLAFLLAWAVFGGVAPGALAATIAATTPTMAYRARRGRRLAVAQEAWPRLIEEIRVLVTSAGRSIPQAVFLVGRRAPTELSTAFDSAHREWLLTTDFERALRVLKTELSHPTADIACETLLTAHEVGGVDLDRRLRDLADDRIADVQARKDARAKQAGARFARSFVLAVPLGMAMVGLSIGRGRAAYETAVGQTLVAVGLLLLVACWLWASRIMAIPAEKRVFDR